MHPRRERACDELLENPLLRTPPPELEKPRPPRERKRRVFKMAPRFPLLDLEFYNSWCNHQKELQLMKHKVDDKPPPLYPELYLKPRRLDIYARQLEANMNVNKELLKKINYIQRTGGFVDCWNKVSDTNYNELLCQQRQRLLDEIQKSNKYMYKRIKFAKSETPTKEFDKCWEDTKHKLVLGASVKMELCVKGGSKVGRVCIELFTDLVPLTCKLFMGLVRGDTHGYAYSGTRFFRVVPNLYCRGGDVAKDNGYGCYLPEGEAEPMGAERHELKHSVPGVLSMVVTPDNEVCGQFNIIFKPMPQFDGKHVVFGRILTGPPQTLVKISELGLPLGNTTSDCVIRYCGLYTSKGYHEGMRNTIKFPPRGSDVVIRPSKK